MSFKVEYANEIVKTFERTEDQSLLWEHQAEDGTREVQTEADLFSGIEKTVEDGTVLRVRAVDCGAGVSHFCGYLDLSPKLSSRFLTPKSEAHLRKIDSSYFDRFVEFYWGCTFCNYDFEKKTWTIGFDCTHCDDVVFFRGHVNGNYRTSLSGTQTFKSREFVMDVLEKAYKKLTA